MGRGSWLPATLQFVRPYYTPVDVEKGTKWATEISAELEKSDMGVICLTRENVSKPWILFEAGALSKKPRSHVCTLLFGIAKTDVEFPLAMFQATEFTKDDFKKLLETINNAGGDSKLGNPILDQVFEMWWPKLEGQVAKILGEYKPADGNGRRSVEDMVKEILEFTRSSQRGEVEVEKRHRERLQYYLMCVEELKGRIEELKDAALHAQA